MQVNLPHGAERIQSLRLSGHKPEHAVIVSCIDGPSVGANPAVFVHAANHDWRFLVGLEVYVFVGRGAKFVKQTLEGVARYARNDLALWDQDQRRGMNVLPVWEYDEKWKPKRLKRWAYLTWSQRENEKFAA